MTRLRLRFLGSLQARLIMLTLAIMFLVVAVTLGTANHYQKQFAQTVTVEITATTIRTLRAALAEVPPSRRADFVRRASQNQWHLWSQTLPSGTHLQRRPHQEGTLRRPVRNPPPQAVALRKNLREFVEALNLKLDDEVRIGLSRGPTPRLYLSLLPDNNKPQDQARREWLVIPLDQLAPPLPLPMAIIWLSAMGILLLLSAAFSWHITRPLRSLAGAADQLAAGQPRRVIPTGPSETRILGERFNAMLDALAQAQNIRNTLLAGLPHDLKGPLSRMWLRTEMLDNPGIKKGLLDDIQDMQRIVNQFIEFVRGSDPASYRFEPLDMNTWLNEKARAWQDTGTDVRLHSLPPGPLTVQADPVALSRLLDNLITNALNHAVPPVDITLDQQNGQAVMTISDYGKGIAEDRREEALRPFSRLDEARTRTGSVGLGLASSDAIAKAHGGSLSLDRASGGGLKVVVKLPAISPSVHENAGT